LQVSYDSVAKACGKSSFAPGESASCSMDYALSYNSEGKMLLRAGEDPYGVQKKNTIVLKTVDHAAEQRFYCQ
jgi:hypothetical protein